MKETQGSLSSIPFPKILHDIYLRADAYGVLDIVREPVKKRFFFKDGVPVASNSNVLGEVLGRLLMQEGVITEREYEDSLEEVIREKKRHGEVLISMGLLNESNLETYLALQLRRRLLSIFAWSDGAFSYTRADGLPADIPQIPAHPAKLILEGISLGFYPAARIQSDLSEYLDKPLVVDNAALERYPLEEFGLNLQEKKFIESFDGEVTLSGALGTSDLLKHRALSLSLCLITTGVLRPAAGAGAGQTGEVVEASLIETLPTATRLNAELMFMRARSALENEDYYGAVEMLEQITELNPTEAEYWAYYGWAIFKENPERLAEASKIIKDAIDLDNELDIAWYFLGMVSLEAGNAGMAAEAFATAVEKNPWMLEALAEKKRLEITRSMERSSVPARLHPAYTVRLGFTEDPFTMLPAARFQIFSASQSKGVIFLERGIKKKSGPLMLTGPDGAGKTTVVLEALRSITKEKVLAIIVLDPPAREIELIKEINEEAGSPIESPSVKEQLLSLGMKLSQNKIQGGHSVLVIDNAHRLTDGCLKFIQYLSRLKTLQVVLVGEISLAARLEDDAYRELRGKLAGSFTLEPFAVEETRAYINRRLERAAREPGSGEAAPVFDASEIEEIHRSSSGLPGLVNERASAMLNERFGVDSERPDPGLPEESSDSDFQIFDTMPDSFETTEKESAGVESEGADAKKSAHGTENHKFEAPPETFETNDAQRTHVEPEETGAELLNKPGEGAVAENIQEPPRAEMEAPSAEESFTTEFDFATGEKVQKSQKPAEPAPEARESAAPGAPETKAPAEAASPATAPEAPVKEKPVSREEAPSAPQPEAPAAPKPVASADHPPEEKVGAASAPPLDEDAAVELLALKHKKGGLLRLFIWVVVMLAAGLVIGSIIGVLWLGPADNSPIIDKLRGLTSSETAEETIAPPPPPPGDNTAE